MLPRLLLLLFTVAVQAAPRVLPPGELPNDVRLAPLKDLDGYFPFTPSPSPDAWQQRAEQLRLQMRVALGLWPEPTRTPLRAVIHGRIERDDYTVEKVYFEAMPGFFVTGNLYRPKNASGKVPGVLAPHGHWPEGRFTHNNDKAAQKELATGSERFESGARSPLQARCVGLARAGCVAFHWDMIGYCDSVQLPFELAHKFAKQRPEMNGADGWGFFSPRAEANAQSIMGLQTWIAMRALDFLESLPDVDPKRLAITGESGGGTQTMILAALDPRVAAAFPAVMVSTAMQGGCTCENAALLRIGTGNVEFAALFAPKPMAMSAADDWTKELPSKGFPDLQKHWAMLGAPDNVQLTAHLQFPHNFNAPNRAAMLAWFNKHLALGRTEAQLAERDFQLLTRDEMSVWNAEHPAPTERGPEFEKKLLQWWMEDTRKQLEKGWQEGTRENRGDKNAARNEHMIAGLEVALGRTLRDAGEVTWELKEKRDAGSHLVMTGLIRNTTHGEELPAVFLHPKQWNGSAVLWLDAAGKSALFAPGDGEVPTTHARALVDAGFSVIGVDLFEQGEFRADGQPLTQTRRVKNPREAAAYTFGYNHALFAQRVHDILSITRLVRTDERHRVRRFALVAPGPMGPLSIAAAFLVGDALDAHACDEAFRVGLPPDAPLTDPNFLPAAARYGGLGRMLLFSHSRPGVPETSEHPLQPAAVVEWLKERLR